MQNITEQMFDYKTLLNRIKLLITTNNTDLRSLTIANGLDLFWDIGKCILDTRWDSTPGMNVFNQLSSDLSAEYPETNIFSDRNLEYMRNFATRFPDFATGQRLAA